jgi:hypothetical protein
MVVHLPQAFGKARLKRAQQRTKFTLVESFDPRWPPRPQGSGSSVLRVAILTSLFYLGKLSFKSSFIAWYDVAYFCQTFTEERQEGGHDGVRNEESVWKRDYWS